MGVTMARPPPPHLLSCPLSSVESEGGSDGGGDLQGELHLATSGGAPPLLASGHSSSTAISASKLLGRMRSNARAVRLRPFAATGPICPDVMVFVGAMKLSR